MAKKSEQEHSLVITALDKTKAAFKSIQSGLGDMVKSVNSAKGALAGVGIAVSTASFASLVKEAIESTAALKKLQIQTGLSAEAISGLNYATKGDTEQVGKAISQLSKAAYEASNGSDEAKKTFSALGISFQKTNGQLKTSEELFSDVAGAISKLPDGLQKSALTQKIFGEEGAKLIPLLNKGSQVFKVLGDEARKYGVVLSQDVIDASAQFVKETEKISRVLNSGSQVWAAKLAPGLAVIASAIQGVVQEESDLQAKNDELKKTGSDWAKTFVTSAAFVMDALDGVKRVFVIWGKGIGTYLGTVVEGVSILGRSLVGIGDILKKLGSGDFKGAKQAFDSLKADAKNGFDNLLEQSKSFAQETAKVLEEDLEGEALRRNFAKAEKLQADQQKAVADRKAGILSAEEKYKNRMLGLQQELSRGMQTELTKQIRDLDKLKAKLEAAKTRKAGIGDEYQAARDELNYGSVQGVGANAREEIATALRTASTAKQYGKFDIADSEAKKVVSMLQDAKRSSALATVEYQKQYQQLSDDLDTAQAELRELESRGGVGDPDAMARRQAAQDKFSSLLSQRDDLTRTYDKNQFSPGELNDLLDRAQSIAQDAADKNVDTLQKKVTDVNAAIDQITAKLKALASMPIEFTVDNDKAIRDAEAMMDRLNAYIRKNPLVITPTFAPTLDASEKAAADLVPEILRSRSGLSALGDARLPAAATGGSTGTVNTSTDNRTQPVQLTVPGVGSYDMSANQDIVDQINRDFQRQRLKAGE